MRRVHGRRGKLLARYDVYVDGQVVGQVITTRRMHFPVTNGQAHWGLFCNSRGRAAELVADWHASYTKAVAETTRMSAKAPWPCPKCGAVAGNACRTNPGSKTDKLPQMHIARWNARPTNQEDR